MKWECQITKESESWQEAAVAVPPSWSHLEIRMEIEEKYALLCNFILLDPQGNVRMLRQMGYCSSRMLLTDDSRTTTPGGVPGTIMPGTWRAVICLFSEYVEQHLGDDSFLIRMKIKGSEDVAEPPEDVIGEMNWNCPPYDFHKICQPEERWYKGDFHTHTQLSDGKETVASAMKKAELMKLDYYVPTEHNVIHTGWISCPVMILPGIEITTCKGHFNIFGINKMPERLLDILRYAGEEQVLEAVRYTMEEAEKNGWLFSVNHPFLHIWKWLDYDLELSRLHFMEIVNDPTYGYARETNDRTIRFLDFLWNQGYIVYGIGGSDSHNLIDEYYEGAEEPSIAGDPGTYVRMARLSPVHLLDAMKRGHIYVSRYITLELSIRQGDREYFPGDEVPEATDGQELIVYEVTVHDSGEQPVLYAVRNGEKLRLPVAECDPGCWKGELCFWWERQVWEWLRIEVRKADGRFLAYVNPIYHGSRKPIVRTYGEALEVWKEEDCDKGNSF